MTTPATPRRDFGYANGWRYSDDWRTNNPPLVNACKQAGHKIHSAAKDRSGRGLDTLFWCDLCNYQYHVDSSG